MKPSEHPSFLRVLFAAVFISAISVPAVATWFISEQGLRVPGEPPIGRTNLSEWRWRTLAHNLHAERSYLEHNYGMRRQLLNAYGRLNRNWLHQSSNPEVAMGDDGWLFLLGGGERSCMRKTNLLSPDELTLLRESIEARRRYLAARNIEYVLAVVPDKHSVYEDMLPNRWRTGRGTSRREQLTEELRRNAPEVHFVDTTSAVIEARASHQVFFQEDTHWTMDGGLAAYGAIIDLLKGVIGDINPANPINLHRRSQPHYGDLAVMLGLFDSQENTEVIDISGGGSVTDARGNSPALNRVGSLTITAGTNAEKKPLSVLLFRDSFGIYLLPFLAETFDHVTDSDGRFNPRTVEALNPDIVIEEILERNLDDLVRAAA